MSSLSMNFCIHLLLCYFSLDWSLRILVLAQYYAIGDSHSNRKGNDKRRIRTNAIDCDGETAATTVVDDESWINTRSSGTRLKGSQFGMPTEACLPAICDFFLAVGKPFGFLSTVDSQWAKDTANTRYNREDLERWIEMGDRWKSRSRRSDVAR